MRHSLRITALGVRAIGDLSTKFDMKVVVFGED